MKNLIIVLLIAFLTSISFAQVGEDWKLGGQIQLRSELDGRDFDNETHPLTFASLRTRLSLEKSFQNKVSFFVQLQDSRVFGEEPSTLASIKGVDLHQGFVKLNKLFGWDWQIQAGRFEMIYGTERFFGAVGWSYTGRSFDGVRFSILPGLWDLDLFALTVKESVGFISNATPSVYPNPQVPTPASSIYGLWKSNSISQKSKLDIFGYYEVDRQKIIDDNFNLSMFTFGGTYWGNYGNFSTIVEAAYQLGRMTGRDLSAYLISVTGDYKITNGKLGAGVDILSGTSPDDLSSKMNTFQPSYATNHKFYGYMDYFISIPNNTLNLGLHDFYLTGNYTPENSDWSFGANIHHFMSNKTGEIITLNGIEEQNTFGQEIDLTIKYNFIKGTALSWGGSLFFPGDLMKSIFSPGEDTAFWTYLMINVNI